MSGAYTVDLERLDAAVASIGSFDSFVDGKLADLNARMDHIRAIWTGAASDEQAAAHREWLAAAAQMRRGLLELRSAASTAHANYTAAHDANCAMWAEVV